MGHGHGGGGGGGAEVDAAKAAKAAAVQKAIERQEMAIQARIRGVELAHEADEALDRAKEAAHLSAAIRRGETEPVPKDAVPASVMKRLAAERREREKKRKGSPEGSDAPDSPASANGKLGSGKKGKQAKAARAPPRPALDIKNDPRAAEVAKMWRKAAELDACAVCGEPDPDRWDAKDEIIFCDGCDLQVHLSCYGMRRVPEGEWLCVGCDDGLDVGKARLGQFGGCALCPQPAISRQAGSAVGVGRGVGIPGDSRAHRVRRVPARGVHHPR